MGRLGVVITETFGGYKEIFSRNKSSEWSSLVDDMRTYTPSSSSMRLIFLRFIPSGTLVGIVRKIEERGDDNNAAWIFVQSNIAVSGHELVNVIDAIDAELKAPVADYQKIAGYFDKEYPESPVVGRSVSLNASELAVRYYESASPFVWSLKDILDSKYIYQPEYHNFKYVFLLNSKEMQNRLQGAAVIAEKPRLSESVRVEPFETIDGFMPYVNGVPFNKPILAFSGETIQVEWRKTGYKDVTKSFVVGAQKETAYITQSEYLKFVDPDTIVIFDRSTRQQVRNARVHIQGRLLQETGLYIPEFQYNRADISIDHTEYESVRLQGQDLSKTISVSLEARMLSYKFRMQLKDGSNCDIVIQSSVPVKECPIKGYELASGNRPHPEFVNRLTYKKGGNGSGKSIITWLIILIIGLLAGAGIMFALGKTTSLFEAKRVVPVEYLPTNNSNNAGDADRQLNAAIEYLEENDVWEKSAMEKHLPLKGLWDALNTYDFENVLNEYADLRESGKFGELIDLIEDNRGNFHRQNFTSAGDNTITLSKYKSAVTRSDSSASKPAAKQTNRVNAQQGNKATGTPVPENSSSSNDNQDDW
jgi:ribosomal protein S16